MKTWSWTHDFESYLYWWKWPISGSSIIRDAGKEKNKAIKGESRGRRVTNLILTKLKGYSTQNIKIMSPISPILQQFDRAEATEDSQIQWYTRGGIKSCWAKGAIMTKKVLYFSQLQKKKTHTKSCLDQSYSFPSISPIFPSLFGRWLLDCDVDGVVVNHNNDSQKRWLYKETHVCSLLFKRPA